MHRMRHAASNASERHRSNARLDLPAQHRSRRQVTVSEALLVQDLERLRKLRTELRHGDRRERRTLQSGDEVVGQDAFCLLEHDIYVGSGRG
jgi:hypothetical protein